MAGRGLFAEGKGLLKGSAGIDPTQGDMDITPMIDVTFLLLIFFMVASTMKGTPEIDVPPADHSMGVETGQAIILTIRADRNGGTAHQILLGDGLGEEADLDGVRRYVEEGVRMGKLKVVLKAEGDVSHGLVDDVAKTIKGVEGVEMFLGVGDKPSAR